MLFVWMILDTVIYGNCGKFAYENYLFNFVFGCSEERECLDFRVKIQMASEMCNMACYMHFADSKCYLLS